MRIAILEDEQGRDCLAREDIVKSLLAFLQALHNPYPYNLRRNSTLWLGIFWGLLLLCYSLDLRVRNPELVKTVDAFWTDPAQAMPLFLPLAGCVLFGAAGTLRHLRELMNERLVQTRGNLAMTDFLTGLPNRRSLQTLLNTLRETASRIRHKLFVILVDLDGFKAVNDQEGHLEGDRVLCAAAEALSNAVRQGGILGRYGGDEFLLAGFGGPDAASRLLERAASAVRSRVGLAFSSGIAGWSTDGEGLDDVLAEADQALGRSKRKSHESRRLPRLARAAESREYGR